MCLVVVSKNKKANEWYNNLQHNLFQKLLYQDTKYEFCRISLFVICPATGKYSASFQVKSGFYLFAFPARFEPRLAAAVLTPSHSDNG